MSELRSRLVMALIEALKDDDPKLIIAIGDQELKVAWKNVRPCP